VLRSRKRGSIHPLPHTSLRTGKTLPFTRNSLVHFCIQLILLNPHGLYPTGCYRKDSALSFPHNAATGKLKAFSPKFESQKLFVVFLNNRSTDQYLIKIEMVTYI
jgi:hypothetical protein